MTGILKTDGVCRYFGGLKAVEDVSMQVNSGEIYGIIGPNGAGKTTFFNVCSGIYKPSKGKVYFCGQDVSEMSQESISRLGVGRTFQSSQLFQFMSVLDNVKIGCHMGTKTTLIDAILHTKTFKKDEKYAEEKAMDILCKEGLEKYAKTLAGNLPYGIQRRVEIARSLSSDPKILMLDEPAAGMNRLETDALRDFIMELNDQGQTILLIEHDMKFVMNCCHKIMVLNFGKKICEGTPGHVCDDKVVQTAYFGSGTFGKEANSCADS